ncbi:MAG TPA: helix-turn-helix transcriptional regulator [Terriglobales bacterium]|nr:helix-turn-helix transcriptional regulator [Terriglobales bacterium]
MTMTLNPDDSHETARYLTPAEIGALVRTIRVMQGWSQETLAELSGLQTRTIQRVEQGQTTSLDTKRAIARAFKLEDIDFFNSLKAFPSDEQIRRQQEAFKVVPQVVV